MKNQRGQSLVEFALILPLLLLLLMGIIEFGRIFNAYLVISNLSRDGARYAATGRNDDWTIQYIKSNATTLDGGELTIIFIDEVEGSRNPGAWIRVQVDYNLTLITPIINNILPNPMQLSAQTTMRVE
jgi:Flp pilus assembly protein TadG